MEIDLHGMDILFARGYLKEIIEYTNEKELTIIHGYNSGNGLKKLVQKDFKHKKIKNKLVSMNKGITIYILY